MSEIKIVKFTFNPLGENTYLLYRNGKAVIVDPGMYEKYEYDKVDKFLFENGLKLDFILATHCHLDHIAGVRYLQEKYKVSFHIPKGEVEVLKYSEISANMYGLNMFQKVEEYSIIENENTIDIFNESWKILYVPGHSPGHFAYYQKELEVVLSGDVLFQGSFGRYDLPGGDFATLKKSIVEKMFSLPENTKILSGHGPITTIGEEKLTNMILNYS